MRISRQDSRLLAIDRRAEFANSQAAARPGPLPAVVEYDPDQHLLVIEYVDGHTLTDADLDTSPMLRAARTHAGRLHAGPRFVNEFDMFDVQQSLSGHRRAARLPAAAALPGVHAAGRAHPGGACRRTRSETVPCNNDLLAANLIDDGDRIWVIDYEYSGNNDPCFELGQHLERGEPAPEHLDVLVTPISAQHVRRWSPGPGCSA